jgi:hypothetical protein
LIALALAMMTVVGTYFLLHPNVSVEPDTTVDPMLPMLTPFRVTNEGVLPIYDVKWSIEMNDVATYNHNIFRNITSINRENKVYKLASKEATAVSIEPVIFAHFSGGDIVIVVTYRTIIGIACTEVFRFATKAVSEGGVRWYHKAMSERQ